MKNVGEKFKKAIPDDALQKETKTEKLETNPKLKRQHKKDRIIAEIRDLSRGSGLPSLTAQDNVAAGLRNPAGNASENAKLLLQSLFFELNQLQNMEEDETIDEVFFEEYLCWIQGVIPKHMSEERRNKMLMKTWWWWVDKRDNTRGISDTSQMPSANQFKLAPVKLHGEEFVVYLRSFVDKKHDFWKKMTMLKSFIPGDLHRSWLYWKYIINETPVLESDYLAVLPDDFTPTPDPTKNPPPGSPFVVGAGIPSVGFRKGNYETFYTEGPENSVQQQVIDKGCNSLIERRREKEERNPLKDEVEDDQVKNDLPDPEITEEEDQTDIDQTGFALEHLEAEIEELTRKNLDLVERQNIERTELRAQIKKTAEEARNKHSELQKASEKEKKKLTGHFNALKEQLGLQQAAFRGLDEKHKRQQQLYETERSLNSELRKKMEASEIKFTNEIQNLTEAFNKFKALTEEKASYENEEEMEAVKAISLASFQEEEEVKEILMEVEEFEQIEKINAAYDLRMANYDRAAFQRTKAEVEMLMKGLQRRGEMAEAQAAVAQLNKEVARIEKSVAMVDIEIEQELKENEPKRKRQEEKREAMAARLMAAKKAREKRQREQKKTIGKFHESNKAKLQSGKPGAEQISAFKDVQMQLENLHTGPMKTLNDIERRVNEMAPRNPPSSGAATKQTPSNATADVGPALVHAKAEQQIQEARQIQEAVQNLPFAPTAATTGLAVDAGKVEQLSRTVKEAAEEEMRKNARTELKITGKKLFTGRYVGVDPLTGLRLPEDIDPNSPLEKSGIDPNLSARMAFNFSKEKMGKFEIGEDEPIEAQKLLLEQEWMRFVRGMEREDYEMFKYLNGEQGEFALDEVSYYDIGMGLQVEKKMGNPKIFLESDPLGDLDKYEAIWKTVISGTVREEPEAENFFDKVYAGHFNSLRFVYRMELEGLTSAEASVYYPHNPFMQAAVKIAGPITAQKAKEIPFIGGLLEGGQVSFSTFFNFLAGRLDKADILSLTGKPSQLFPSLEYRVDVSEKYARRGPPRKPSQRQKAVYVAQPEETEKEKAQREKVNLSQEKEAASREKTKEKREILGGVLEEEMAKKGEGFSLRK